MSGEAEARKPTEKEAYFFLTILNSQKSAPDVDWDLVAQRAGYSNGNCAKTRYGQIKRQLGYKSDGSIGAPGPAKIVKKAVGSGTNKNASKVTKSRTPKKHTKSFETEFFGAPADDDELYKLGTDGMGYENAENGEDEFHFDEVDELVFYEANTEDKGA